MFVVFVRIVSRGQTSDIQVDGGSRTHASRVSEDRNNRNKMMAIYIIYTYKSIAFFLARLVVRVVDVDDLEAQHLGAEVPHLLLIIEREERRVLMG